MSSLVIFFLALIAVSGRIKIVESTPPQVLDLSKILELFKQQKLAGSAQQLLKDRSDSYSDSLIDHLTDKGDSDDLDDDNHNARLRKQSIIDLIESVANQKKNRPRNNNYQFYPNEKPSSDLNTYVSRNDKRVPQKNLLHNLVIEQLLSRGLNEDEIKTKSKNYLLNKSKPNRLASSLKGDIFKRRYKNKEPTRLEDYTNIVIVLNPQAVQKGKNKNSLNDLISNILSASSLSSKNVRQAKRKPLQYRFDVNENRLQRRNGQSKEKYGRRDSAGEEYNQKRSNRNGGNPAGRTAIPYIRHRGDIYEREE